MSRRARRGGAAAEGQAAAQASRKPEQTNVARGPAGPSPCAPLLLSQDAMTLLQSIDTRIAPPVCRLPEASTMITASDRLRIRDGCGAGVGHGGGDGGGSGGGGVGGWGG